MDKPDFPSSNHFVSIPCFERTGEAFDVPTNVPYEALFDMQFKDVFRESRPNSSVLKCGTLRLLTFNVLMDCFNGAPYCIAACAPRIRYNYLFEHILRGGYDIVALNEVGRIFLALYAQHEVSQHYFVSDSLRASNVTKKGFGNCMLVSKRLQIVPRFYTVPLPKQERRAIVCHLGATVVACAHLIALSKNVENRRIQLHELCRVIESVPGVDTLIICGDLNFHVDEDNASIPNHWRDAVYDDYTWNSDTNKMHAIMWPLGFESRKMTLDRILFRGAVEVAKPQIVLNERISNDVPLLNNDSTFNRALWQVGLNLPDIRSYLCPSDHFGLAAEIRFVGAKL